MGSNTLTTQVAGGIETASDLNQYKTALIDTHVPRNSAGVPTDEAGSLGTDSLAWLKAYIASGCWNTGDIKPHHTYNDAAYVGQGWFPCNGDIINEANYDLVHGTGAWSEFVSSSALEGRYSPNLASKYISGATATTQDGTSPITSVGNVANTISFAHTHTTSSHNHTWYSSGVGGTASGIYAAAAGNHKTYNSFGSIVEMLPPHGPGFTSMVAPSTNEGALQTKSVQPESIEIIYYIRIV